MGVYNSEGGTGTEYHISMKIVGLAPYEPNRNKTCDLEGRSEGGGT